jgi:hypothetical protein
MLQLLGGAPARLPKHNWYLAMPNWSDTLARIHALAAEMPDLKIQYQHEADFLAAFAGIAEGIQDDADRIGDDASHSAWILLHNMLVDHG